MSEFLSVTDHIRHTLWPKNIGKQMSRAALSRGAAVLIGAGFSQNAVMLGDASAPPDWAMLSDRLVEQLCPDDDGAREKMLREAGAVSGFLRISQKYEVRFGRAALNDLLLDAVDDSRMRPGPLHDLLLRLPWTDIFTTNWDRLLERAAEHQFKRKYHMVYSPDDLPITSRPRIFKLHGSTPNIRPFTFTEEDFRRYPTERAAFVNAVQQSMLEHVFVLIGFSGDDPNFLRWSGWVRDRLGGSSPKIFMVNDFQDQGDHVDLMHSLNIRTVDLSDTPDEVTDMAPKGVTGLYARRLGGWLAYLAAGEPADPLDWPPTSSSVAPTFNGSSVKTDWSENELLALVYTEIGQLRADYPAWLIAPPDAREIIEESLRSEIQDLMANTMKPDVEDLGADKLGPLFKKIERLCAMHCEKPADLPKAMKDTLPGVDAPLLEFARAYEALLWLIQTGMKRWPLLAVDALKALVGPIEDNDAWPENTVLVRTAPEEHHQESVSLAVTLSEYLQNALRMTSEDAKSFKVVTANLKRHFERTFQWARFNRVLYCEALARLDRGDTRKVCRIVKEWSDESGDPMCDMRLASLCGTIDGVSTRPKHRQLRLESITRAYLKCRENFSYEDEKFSFVSCESWIVAYLVESGFSQHNAKEENITIDGQVTDALLRANNTARLSELMGLRCDPRRDLRRMQRSDDVEVFREGARILDTAGWPIFSARIDPNARLTEDDTILTELALNSFGTQAAERMLNEAYDLVTREAGNAPQVDRLTSDALALILRCRVGASGGPSIMPRWKALSAHLPALGEWLAHKDRQVDGDAPQIGQQGGRTAEILIHALNASVVNLMSDTPTSDSLAHFHNVICLVGKFTERLVPSHVNDSDQKRLLKWPDHFVKQALKCICSAMEAFVVKVEMSGLNTSQKLEAAAYLEALAGILQRQILIKAEGDDVVVQEMLQRFWDIPTSEGNMLRDPLVLVQQLGRVRLPREKRQIDKKPLAAALAKVTRWGKRPPARRDKKKLAKRLRLMRLYDCLRDLNFEIDSELQSKFEEHIPLLYRHSRFEVRPWEWLLINEVHEAKADFTTWVFKERLPSMDEDGLLADPADHDRGQPNWAATEDVLDNVAWALRNNRSSFVITRKDHANLALTWVSRLLRNPPKTGWRPKLRNAITEIAITHILTSDKLLTKVNTDLVIEVVVALHSQNFPVDRVITHLARRFAHAESGVSPRTLGAFLRHGLMSQEKEKVRRSIMATNSWLEVVQKEKAKQIEKAKQEKQEERAQEAAPLPVLRPPQALLGALSQVLATGEDNQDNTVLSAIREIMRINGETGAARPIEMLPVLLSRVQLEIEKKEKLVSTEAFKQLVASLSELPAISDDALASEALRQLQAMMSNGDNEADDL